MTTALMVSRDVLTAREKRMAMVRLVSRQTKIPVSEIMGQSREVPVVQARHRVMLLVRVVFGDSYPKIGRLFGGLDHSTIINGVARALGLPSIKKTKVGRAGMIVEALTTQLYYTLLFEGLDAIDHDAAAKAAVRWRMAQEIDYVLAA